jgi:uncharacterized membrane protein
MTGTDTELILVALAAMLSPTTLSFCLFALVLGDRPLRTGLWFYAGALGATLGIGVVAAFVLGNAATSHTSTPKTWVAVVDIVAGVLLLVYVWIVLRRPRNTQKEQAMIERMSKVASSPVIAIVGAGAALANPGAFIPIALKDISERNPDATQYVVQWVLFSLISLLPLGVALLLLVVSRDWTMPKLHLAHGFLERHVRTVAAVLVVLLAVALIRNGIVGLT